MTLHKTAVLSGLVLCVTSLFFTYRPVKNFFALLMVPVGDQGINIVSLELAILKNPNDATAYYNRGTLYNQELMSKPPSKILQKLFCLAPKNLAKFLVQRMAIVQGVMYTEGLVTTRKLSQTIREQQTCIIKQGKYSEYEYMAKLIESSY